MKYLKSWLFWMYVLYAIGGAYIGAQLALYR